MHLFCAVAVDIVVFVVVAAFFPLSQELLLRVAMSWKSLLLNVISLRCGAYFAIFIVVHQDNSFTERASSSILYFSLFIPVFIFPRFYFILFFRSLFFIVFFPFHVIVRCVATWRVSLMFIYATIARTWWYDFLAVFWKKNKKNIFSFRLFHLHSWFVFVKWLGSVFSFASVRSFPLLFHFVYSRHHQQYKSFLLLFF